MAIFNSYVKLPEGNVWGPLPVPSDHHMAILLVISISMLCSLLVVQVICLRFEGWDVFDKSMVNIGEFHGQIKFQASVEPMLNPKYTHSRTDHSHHLTISRW
jgi:hypothetical protein